MPVLTQSDSLASAIDNGPANAIYELDRDFIWYGDYTFTKPITLRSTLLADHPPGIRVGADLIGARLRGQLMVDPLVASVRMEGIRIEGTNRDKNLIECYGDRFALDRCYATGALEGQRRGVYLGGSGSFTDSTIDNIIYPGNGDTQAIAAERDAHDVMIDNCYLESAGEVIMVGGGPVFSESRMCRNWTIIRSELNKRIAWRQIPSVAKNIFELKAVDGCVIKDTILRHSWSDAQTGFAIVLTPRNQTDTGTDPFVAVKNVLFDNVEIIGCASGISILGRDDIFQSERTTNIQFRNVCIKDISRHSWGVTGGEGRVIQILGGPKDVVFDGFEVQAGPPDNHATDPDGVPAINYAILFDVRTSELCEGLVVHKARMNEGCYGVWATGNVSVPGGLTALNAAAPGWQWQEVEMIRGGVRNFVYPPGTVLLNG